MAKKGRVIDKRAKWDAFTRVVSDMGEQKLVVGIVGGEIATYAAANEFGTTRAGSNHNVVIPSRPFMRTTIDNNKDKYAKLLARGARAGITGGPAAVNAHMIALGLVVRNDIIKAIVGWSDPPNADSTIERKGVNNPLVDTGAMQRALTFDVRKRTPGGG